MCEPFDFGCLQFVVAVAHRHDIAIICIDRKHQLGAAVDNHAVAAAGESEFGQRRCADAGIEQ